MKSVFSASTICVFCLSFSCSSPPKGELLHFVTIDPGHFHAALVQKSMYDGVDSTAHVYAPDGPDLALHLERIKSYNTSVEDPTHWNEVVYRGGDFFDRFIHDNPGNVVILSGNNRLKADYLYKSLQQGYHVLADKPMAISSKDFETVKSAFSVAKEKGIVLYDIMTERFEVTNQLQRELAQIPDVFGSLERGTVENPAVVKESVHHFYKNVSGKPLIRPAWFMDTRQQGEGIVDVTTHLVDLAQWASFPGIVLDTTDVEFVSAKRSATKMSLSQFSGITKLETWPDFLLQDVAHDTLHVFSNGVINYKLRGIHIRTSVLWKYQAAEGAGDTHYSIMRGSLVSLVIRQGPEQGNKPVLYIEPTGNTDLGEALTAAIARLQRDYPGITLVKETKGWSVLVPSVLQVGHEAHFAQVTRNFIRFVKGEPMPAWEIPNMIVKYYTTTGALALLSDAER